MDSTQLEAYTQNSMARTKRREELYITLPNLFRCPISMDVMKSPVSLCTGVTYDRSSIERWLALGNNTCPATMQKLPSTHTTPNLTLRRLIQLWVAQAELTHSTPSPSTPSKQNAADAINGEMDAESAARLIVFMKSSEENFNFVSSSDRALSRLVEVFGNNSDEVSTCEAVTEILDLLIASGNGVKEKLSELILKNRDGNQNCLSSFVTILRKGNSESKVRVARILASIATNHEFQRTIAQKEGLLYELHHLFTAEKNKASAVVEAGLSALLTISTSRPVQKELIRIGIVRTVTEILSGEHDYSTPQLRTGTETALAILESTATCNEGRNAIMEDEKCVIEIVNTLMKCSGTATEHCVTILWSVCCLSRDRTSIERAVDSNGLTKVLLVMQSDCSASTRQMCAELVKVLRAKTTRSSLSTYETRTTHITPY